jgi:hypothetical protein
MTQPAHGCFRQRPRVVTRQSRQSAYHRPASVLQGSPDLGSGIVPDAMSSGHDSLTPRMCVLLVDRLWTTSDPLSSGASKRRNLDADRLRAPKRSSPRPYSGIALRDESILRPHHRSVLPGPGIGTDQRPRPLRCEPPRDSWRLCPGRLVPLIHLKCWSPSGWLL